MDSSRLLIDFGTLLARYTDVRKFLTLHDSQATLKKLCLACDTYPGVASTLGLLHRERPDLYEFSLLCACISLPLGAELKLDDPVRKYLFIAALLQECGQVCNAGKKLPPEAGPLAHEAFPLLGKEVVDALADIPEEVGQILVCQRERYDGTGYPEGRLGPTMNPEQHALALSNELVRIRMGAGSGGTRNLANCMPVLRVNQGHHFTDECRALLALLIGSGLNPGTDWSEDQAPELIDDLLAQARCLDQWVVLLEPMSAALGQAPISRNLTRCRLLARNLQWGTRSAGMLDASVLRWAEHVRDKRLSEYYPELEELAAMHNELFEQLNWILMFLGELVDDITEQGGNPMRLNLVLKAMEKVATARAKLRGDDDMITMEF